jgi:hypothetical protein
MHTPADAAEWNEVMEYGMERVLFALCKVVLLLHARHLQMHQLMPGTASWHYLAGCVYVCLSPRLKTKQPANPQSTIDNRLCHELCRAPQLLCSNRGYSSSCQLPVEFQWIACRPGLLTLYAPVFTRIV